MVLKEIHLWRLNIGNLSYANKIMVSINGFKKAVKNSKPANRSCRCFVNLIYTMLVLHLNYNFKPPSRHKDVAKTS